MNQAVVQGHPSLLGVKPPSPFRQRVALWFKRVAVWLEAYPPIVDYQPPPPQKFEGVKEEPQ